eukprot:403356287
MQALLYPSLTHKPSNFMNFASQTARLPSTSKKKTRSNSSSNAQLNTLTTPRLQSQNMGRNGTLTKLFINGEQNVNRDKTQTNHMKKRVKPNNRLNTFLESISQSQQNRQVASNHSNLKTPRINHQLQQISVKTAFDIENDKADEVMSKLQTQVDDANFIDFELMKKIHAQCQLEENTNGKIMNPCFNHPLRPIKFICRDDQNGLCSECMIEHFSKDHNLLSIEDQIKHVQTVLLNLEQNLQEILKSKNNILKKHEAQIEFLNHSKRQFLAEQKQKIEQLKKYLDDRYLHIVCQYNLAYEKDLILNKNKIDTVSEKIHENMHHIKKIQKLRDEFITLANDGESQQNHEDIKSFRGGVPIGDIQTIESKIIKNFVKTGKFLDYYNYIKDKNQQKAQKNVQKVFTTHAIDSVKYLSINVEKEIQLLTKKFKDLNFKQEQANQLLQKYQRSENNDDSFDHEPKRAQKISIPRWFSKKMAEFDFDKDQWQASQIKKLDLPIFPFSSLAYSSEMNEYFILGGFNNKVEGKSTFSSRVFKIIEEQVNPFESVYTAQFLAPMRKQRGCFSSAILITRKYKVRVGNEAIILNDEDEDDDFEDSQDGKKKFEFRFEGYLFAIGGKNREDKLLKHCEKYDLKSKQWYQIASLNESRMNASVCAFSQKEGIFVFGGEDLEGYYLNSIEQYLINENKWITLEIQMPSPVSNQVAYKVSKRKILLLGGMKIQESTTSNSGFAKKVISADVYSFNISLGVLRQCKDHSLREPVLSLYPCYQIQDGDFGNLIRASYVNTSRPVTRADINTPNSNNQNTPNANIAVQFGNTLSSNLTNQGSAVGTKSAAVSFKSTVGVKKEDKDEACIYLVSEGKHDTNPTIVPYPIKSFLPGGDNY